MSSIDGSKEGDFFDGDESKTSFAAKNSLYQLSQIEDQPPHRGAVMRSNLVHNVPNIDGLNKWIANSHTIGLSMAHRTILVESECSKKKCDESLSLIPRIKSSLHQWESPTKKQKRLQDKKARTKSSIGELFPSSARKVSALLSLKRCSLTPSIEITKQNTVPVLTSRHQDSCWYISRQVPHREKSAGGAVNIIKRQTQSTFKGNKKPRCSAFKDVDKLRTDWMGLQTFKCLKVRDKLNLAYFNH